MRAVPGSQSVGVVGHPNEQVSEFDRLTQRLEETVEAAEQAVWAELLAGQKAR